MILSFLAVVSLFVTTCDSPMGMGDPIDWEPPRLTLDPVPNPMYVRNDITISGSVTDNVGVDRVILRDAVTGRQRFTASISGNRWEISLKFTREENSEKKAYEIVAFDRAGNSGDTSIKAITFIIDIGDPVIEDLWIERTDTRRYYPIKYNELKDLENTDSYGEKSGHVEDYQNGWFRIKGKTSEIETQIDIISLNIYDVNDLKTPLLTIKTDFRQENTETISRSSPSWLIKEEDILEVGDRLFGGSYSNTYYNSKGRGDNAGRYYYRMEVIAIDKSKNEGMGPNVYNGPILEHVGYFCMWQNADAPKGIIDPSIGTTVNKQSSFPVEFFDDDAIHTIYTDLLTQNQWNGQKPLASNVYMMGHSVPTDLGDTTNEQKLEWLKERLTTAGFQTYNWRFDIYTGDTSGQIKEILEDDNTKKVENKWVYVPVGSTDNDYGDFVLFTLIEDKKLAPHEAGEPSGQQKDTHKSRWSVRSYNVSVVDDNKPVIVFDTTAGVPEQIPGAQTGGSPEENTFPKLYGRNAGDEGQYFTINGYTMRTNRVSTGPGDIVVENKVIKFRMAWIPADMPRGDDFPNGTDDYVAQVQLALSGKDENHQVVGYPASFNRPEFAGIQHWNFVPPGRALAPGEIKDAELIDGSPEITGGGASQISFTKQVFKKEFDILGGNDNLKPTYKNFVNQKGEFENLTKLFVFYAEDEMGHIVYRQIRLLGNTKPPNLIVYDITGDNNDISTGVFSGIPDVSKPPHNGVVTLGYRQDLKDFNKRSNVIQYLRECPRGIAMEPFKIHPRETVLKFYVTAEEVGDLAVKNITMKDITFENDSNNPIFVGSDFIPATRDHTFCEYLYDEGQRVFLFEATDSLGNTARLQRTVAISNAARLENITTTRPEGTYGIGTEIVLRANFSGQISVSNARPKLNIRFKNDNSINQDKYVYRSIEAEDVTSLSSTLKLEFKYTVQEGDYGDIETIYKGLGQNTGSGDITDRPIDLNGAVIKDVARGTIDAFVPGYAMPNWTNDTGSLQASTRITLDGRKPKIETVSIGGKIAYSKNTDQTTNQYYFNKSETVELYLTASKPISPSDTPPSLKFTVRDGIGSGNETEYQLGFDYQRPYGSNGMVFSLRVDNPPYTSFVNGEITSIKLITSGAGKITCVSGNEVANPGDDLLKDINVKNVKKDIVYIKKDMPAAPVSYLNSQTIGTSPNSTSYYNSSPLLTVGNLTTTFGAWEDVIEYSLDGGLSWDEFGITGSGAMPESNGMRLSKSGSSDLRIRRIDRAGNEGAHCRQLINVNNNFPKLIAVNVVDPSGWYKSGTLSFTLDFDGAVRVDTSSNVQIVLTNRGSDAQPPSTGSININNMVLNASGQANIDRQGNTSITFTWPITGQKEMRAGMYISYIRLDGLRDTFSNPGPVVQQILYNSGNPQINPPLTNTTPISNISDGVKVDNITPSINTSSPGIGGIATDVVNVNNDYRNIITLNFTEPVMRGMGVITIKPKSDFLIPPVFEDNGYYLDQFSGAGNIWERQEIKSTVNTDGRTIWMPGFYDIYNNDALDAGDRNTLTLSTTIGSHAADPRVNTPSSLTDDSTPSMTRLVLDERTGQPVGPYVRTTHGLIAGNGYTGNYSGANYTNGPNTDTGSKIHLIPDTSTKWVLAYQYGIHDVQASHEDPAKTANGYGKTIGDLTGKVSAIKEVLKKAEFRWQKIDIVTTNVRIGSITGGVFNESPDGIGLTVRIILNEPLLKGLEWELSYPEGTFTDEAGNEVEEIKTGYNGSAANYTFWSPGVQKPVIRVNRKSYDARTSNWKQPRTANVNNTSEYVYVNPNNNTGWSINDFMTVDYRIETETPQAAISYGYTALNSSTVSGAGNAGPFNAVTAAWSGSVLGSVAGGGYSTIAWDADVGTSVPVTNAWVRPNLIRRGGSSASESGRCIYYVNGDQRRSSGHLRMFRSYNADVESATLQNYTIDGEFTGWRKDHVTFGNLEAGKIYIAAAAKKDHGGTTYSSNRGYEGVFRTLIVLSGMNGSYSGSRTYTGTNRSSWAGYNQASLDRILVEGSNNKAGLPSTAGFPVKDGADNEDSRFAKMMYNNNRQNNGNNNTAPSNPLNTNNSQFYWVSTEIVSEWYFLYYGGGGNTQRTGEVNNYMMVNYGDLTYGYEIGNYPDTQ